MNKKNVIGVILLLMIIISTTGCQKAVVLDDLQKSACESADTAGTCQTRLMEIGIVLPDECCKAMGRCC